MKIYIDFDRTLFDCETFLRDFYALIVKYQIPKKIFLKYQNQCKRKGFNPYIILDKVKKEYSYDLEINNEIKLLIQKSNDYLYSDAIAFLKYLNDLDYEVVILTKGNSDYQKEKILSSNIMMYCNDLIVTMKHKGDLDIDYRNGIFIDDNPNEIESILPKEAKKVIRINRVNSKYSDILVSNVITVSSLDEIIEKKIL